MRADREDVTPQLDRVAFTRGYWAGTLMRLADVHEGPGAADAQQEARDLSRVLSSRAKRPPAPDSAAWLGAVRSYERTTTPSDLWDATVREVIDAESDYDTAVGDLATARGEDA